MHEEVKSFGYRKIDLEMSPHFHIPPGLGGMWLNKKKTTLKLAGLAALMRFGPHPARRGGADR